jgi:hypothetical protein
VIYDNNPWYNDIIKGTSTLGKILRIVLPIVGGVLLIAIIAIAIRYCVKKRKHNR